jgi:26S proteasome regulatory subunit N10
MHTGGRSNYLSALKTAALALKNRQNKNQRQRIIVFVGSPIESDSKELIKLGKQFKKNNIAVDCINFGTENSQNENVEKLEQFINAVNASDNSHLVNIPPGPHILADMILTSNIMADSAQIADFGLNTATNTNRTNTNNIDPNIDPEMAMAIRMSMEEEKQRQERLNQNKATTTTTTTSTANIQSSTTQPNPAEEDEDGKLILYLCN